MATLTKTEQVLGYEMDLGSERVRYSRSRDEPGDTPTIISLDRGTYEDLGRPDKITVAIVPGDLLNS